MNRPRQALLWVLDQHPEARVHIKQFGVAFSPLEGWVSQRGWPAYRVVMTDYDIETDTFDWDEYAISRVGKVYCVEHGLVSEKPIWTPRATSRGSGERTTSSGA